MSQHCEHCGALMAKYWHKMTPGLVKTLVKVYAKVCEKQENIVHKNELDLDHSEYGNFQKLRFHALIAKYKPEGIWVHGSWVITKRGAMFLKGLVKIPQSVRTYRNKIEAHDETFVDVARVMRTSAYWQEYSDFVNQQQDMEFFDIRDEDQEVVATIKRPKKKKGKKYCPLCDSQLKLYISSFDTKDGVVSNIHKQWKCSDINCGYFEKI